VACEAKRVAHPCSRPHVKMVLTKRIQKEISSGNTFIYSSKGKKQNSQGILSVPGIAGYE